MEGEAETCLGGMLPTVGSRSGAECWAAGTTAAAWGRTAKLLLATGAFSTLF